MINSLCELVVVSGSCGWQPMRPALHLLPRLLDARLGAFASSSTLQRANLSMMIYKHSASRYVIRHPMYFPALLEVVQQRRTLDEQKIEYTFYRHICGRIAVTDGA
ncbi:hypothetical protein PQR67_27790 [Paraburkholderia fungorum]|uniref:hypothetical protein n=1 Tax=Paraburkholderia fungorum TaxID=134537 RepID=UPI0038BCFA92